MSLPPIIRQACEAARLRDSITRHVNGQISEPVMARMQVEENAGEAREMKALRPVAGALARMLEKRDKAIGEWLRPLLAERIEGTEGLDDAALVSLAMASGFTVQPYTPADPRPGSEYLVLVHAGQMIGGLELTVSALDPATPPGTPQ